MPMKKLLITILMPFFLLTVMALSCKEDEQSPVEPTPSEHGTIKGNIIEFGSSSPLSLVNVYSVPPTSYVKTDESGNYVIQTVEPGQYQVVAAKIGFDTISVDVTVSAGAVTVADFILVSQNSKDSVKYGQISGAIFNSKTFTPIDKVNLVTVPATSSITSDNFGKYVFENVLPGEYIIKAEKAGFDTTSVSVTVFAGKIAEADIYLTESDTAGLATTGTILGIVKDSQTLLSIKGAVVSTNPSTSSVVTADDGSYKFENVEPGDYTIQISKAGYQDASTKVSVVAGQPTRADFILVSETGSIEGVVMNALTLQPIEGVNIQTQPATLSITTDSLGRYRLNNLPPADYTVTASVVGYQDASLSVVVTAGNTTSADILMSSN